jgi:hypothetical protein
MVMVVLFGYWILIDDDRGEGPGYGRRYGGAGPVDEAGFNTYLPVGRLST